MFKKLKKDRGILLLIFVLEAIIAISLIIVSFSLENQEFVKNYFLYILLFYFVLMNLLWC